MKPTPIAALTLMSLVGTILPLSEGIGRADQPPSVVKHQPVWEYKTEHCGYNGGLPAQLNELGAEGWELVQIADRIAVFKRMKFAHDETIQSGVQIELLEDPGVIVLRGKEKEVKRVTDLMHQNAQERRESASSMKDDQETGMSQQAAQFEVYSLGEFDPQRTLSLLRTLLAGRPDVRFDAIPKTRELIVLARPSDHAIIRAVLEKMRPHSVQAKPDQAGRETRQEKKREEIGDDLAPKLIYLRHTEAAQIAKIIREVYRRKRAVMSVGQIPRLNAIVLVAPDTLFREVKELAEALDHAPADPNQSVLKTLVRQRRTDGIEEGMKASELEHRQRFGHLLEGEETLPPRRFETRPPRKRGR